MQLKRSARHNAGFAGTILIGKTKARRSRGAVSTVSPNTLRHVADRPAGPAEVGLCVRNVEGADVGVRVREARCAVREAIQAEVVPQRFPVELCLKATQALARRMEVQSVAFQQPHIEREVFGQAYRRVDVLQADDFLPVTVGL